MNQQAEERALAASDFENAGWRARSVGWMYFLRRQPNEVLKCADRYQARWENVVGRAREKAYAIRLRGHGHYLNKNYAAAISAYKRALELGRAAEAESEEVVAVLRWLGQAEIDSGDHSSAEQHYRDALRIAKSKNYREGIAVCTGNLAEVALKREKWHEAEAFAHESLALGEHIKRIQLIGVNCHRLAIALEKLDRREEAVLFARRAIDIYTKLRLTPEAEDAQTILKRCQEDVDRTIVLPSLLLHRQK